MVTATCAEKLESRKQKAEMAACFRHGAVGRRLRGYSIFKEHREGRLLRCGTELADLPDSPNGSGYYTRGWWGLSRGC